MKMKKEETEKPGARLQRVPKKAIPTDDVLEDVGASLIRTRKTDNTRKKVQEVVVAED